MTQPRAPRSSLPRRLGAALAATATVAGSLLALAATSTAAPAPTSTPKFVRAVPVCGKVRPGHPRCDSMRLVAAAKNTPGARERAAASDSYPAGPAGGYTPADFASAYGYDPTAATSITVGLVLWNSDPNLKADLNKFDAQYGLPAETSTSLRIVNQTGGTTLPSGDQNSGLELSLDTQAVRGACNKCKIIVVEANNPDNDDLAIAENEAVTLGAKVVSNSWGEGEVPSSPVSSSFVAAFNHKGVAILASTADHGYDDWDNSNASGGSSNSAPDLPASLPTTVAAGGTSLYLNDDASRASETVWNDNGPYDYYGSQIGAALGATGGGCSKIYAAKSWQTGVAGWSTTGCSSKRLAADISADADALTGYDIYDSYGFSGWLTIGGTSLSSPLLAGMWALAGGPHGVTYPAQTLYQNFASSPSSFYDVTVGGNGACDNSSPSECTGWFDYYYGGAPNTLGKGVLDCAFKANSTTVVTNTGACDAKVGYDGPSGVGTPNSLAVFAP